MKQRYFRECDYNVLDSVMEIASERGGNTSTNSPGIYSKKGIYTCYRCK